MRGFPSLTLCHFSLHPFLNWGALSLDVSNHQGSIEGRVEREHDRVRSSKARRGMLSLSWPPEKGQPKREDQQGLASAAVKRGGRYEWFHHLGSVGRDDCRSHRTCGLGQSTVLVAGAIDKRVVGLATDRPLQNKGATNRLTLGERDSVASWTRRRAASPSIDTFLSTGYGVQ